MSLRISGQSDVTQVETSRPANKTVDTELHSTAQQTAAVPAADRADLSSTSGLVQLAKSLTPAHRAEKVTALAARVGSGQYRPSSTEISHAIVQGLFR